MAVFLGDYSTQQISSSSSSGRWFPPKETHRPLCLSRDVPLPPPLSCLIHIQHFRPFARFNSLMISPTGPFISTARAWLGCFTAHFDHHSQIPISALLLRHVVHPDLLVQRLRRLLCRGTWDSALLVESILPLRSHFFSLFVLILLRLPRLTARFFHSYNE